MLREKPLLIWISSNSTPPMATVFTELLREQLKDSFGQPDALTLANTFDLWKKAIQNQPISEFTSDFFGKDGAYCNPKIDGRQYQLRHVHLKPIEDKNKKKTWAIRLQQKSRKTSNRILVYVTRNVDEHLLIFILEEPSAHEIAEMRTEEDKKVMHNFAKIAEKYLLNKIIAA